VSSSSWHIPKISSATSTKNDEYRGLTTCASKNINNGANAVLSRPASATTSEFRCESSSMTLTINTGFLVLQKWVRCAYGLEGATTGDSTTAVAPLCQTYCHHCIETVTIAEFAHQILIGLEFRLADSKTHLIVELSGGSKASNTNHCVSALPTDLARELHQCARHTAEGCLLLPRLRCRAVPARSTCDLRVAASALFFSRRRTLSVPSLIPTTRFVRSG
jgi:hypothetical protein